MVEWRVLRIFVSKKYDCYTWKMHGIPFFPFALLIEFFHLSMLQKHGMGFHVDWVDLFQTKNSPLTNWIFTPLFTSLKCLNSKWEWKKNHLNVIIRCRLCHFILFLISMKMWFYGKFKKIWGIVNFYVNNRNIMFTIVKFWKKSLNPFSHHP